MTEELSGQKTKVLQLKAWPELTSYLPVMLALPKLSKNSVSLDFSNCQSVHSAGLNIFLLQLVRHMTKFPEKNWSFLPSAGNSTSVIAKVRKLGFVSSFSNYRTQNDLWIHDGAPETGEELVEHFDFQQQKMFSSPLYCLKFSEAKHRRQALDGFNDWLYKQLEKFSGFKINIPQIVTIIGEIAKNSADHTQGDAFFGMDFKPLADERLMFSFSFGDFGHGIKNNIWESLSHEVKEKRSKHRGLYEAYYYALKLGYSSKKDSEENRGLGMSIITQGSKKIGLELSVFDGNSRGVLSSIGEISHSELRKCFYDLGRSVGFCYYGQLVVGRKNNA